MKKGESGRLKFTGFKQGDFMKDLDLIFQNEIIELAREQEQIGDNYDGIMKNIGKWEELKTIMAKLGYTEQHINEMKAKQ
jgi:hypothetical protein